MNAFGVDTCREEELGGVSVVVIGRNEGARLQRCLRSVREADYPLDKIELIYVDTDSTDNSCAVAAAAGARVVALEPERPSAAAARNAGLEAARHPIVQFLDGDTILHRDWLKKGVTALADPTVAGVFGRREEVAPHATIYNFWAHHDWYVPPGPSPFCGGDTMFRAEVLRRHGGYDSGLIAGEERDLSFRLLRDEDTTILRLDEPMTLHDMAMTRFGQYWKRCVRAGYAYAEVGARHPGLRAWRRTCGRNIVHAAALTGAGGLSLLLSSPWPMAIWAGLLLLAVARDAWRCKAQVGSVRGALLYAAHHYLSKAPAVVGHFEYYLGRLRGKGSKQLIEYRGDPERAGG